MINTDFHMHCNFSGDSDASMESMIKQAISLGFVQIALTDHIDFSPTGEKLYWIEYDEYLIEFNRLKEKYADQIKLVFGIEMGLEPQIKHIVDDFLKKYPFEFIIGSSHATEMKEHFSQDFFVGKTKKEAHNAYFLEILENVKLYDSFDCYGHLDYIARYGPYADKSLNYADYKEIIDEILKTLIQKGKGIEINTSALRYECLAPYPSVEILKSYKNLGGEIVTVGSDAHRPNHIGYGFDKAQHLLASAGFKWYTVFNKRKPINIMI